MPKKLLDQNFEFLPRFPAIAQKAQNSPKFENRTLPSILPLNHKTQDSRLKIYLVRTTINEVTTIQKGKHDNLR